MKQFLSQLNCWLEMKALWQVQTLSVSEELYIIVWPKQ